MTICSTWVISATLSSIAVLSSRKRSTGRCILRWAFSASVFIFFHNRRVVSCTKDVRRHNFVAIERWSDSWCRLVLTSHLCIMNWIFSLPEETIYTYILVFMGDYWPALTDAEHRIVSIIDYSQSSKGSHLRISWITRVGRLLTAALVRRLLFSFEPYRSTPLGEHLQTRIRHCRFSDRHGPLTTVEFPETLQISSSYARFSAFTRFSDYCTIPLFIPKRRCIGRRHECWFWNVSEPYPPCHYRLYDLPEV